MDGKIALEEHWAIEETLGASRRIVGSDTAWRELHDRLCDIHHMRLAEMDRNGIELAILSLNSPAVQGILNVAEAIATARKANDMLAGEIARRPDRFAAFAALPMQDPEAAIAELTRCVTDLGFKGAMVNGFSQKEVPQSVIYYDLPQYRPFWAAIERLGVPFYLHSRTTIASRALDYDGHPWLFAPAWDFAAQTSVHALRLICSGLFDEFPGLKIILGHLGERIPYDLWRIDNLMGKAPGRPPMKKPLADYLRANFHLTTSGQFNDPAFHCALAVMGAGRILFSVDYPFESTKEAAAWFDGTELSDADRRRMGRTNALALFDLESS